MRYTVGSRVRVQVSRVDLDGRKIDFRLVREGEDMASSPTRSRGRERNGSGGTSPAAELSAVRAEDRSVRAATKGKARGGKSASKATGKVSTADSNASATGAKRATKTAAKTRRR